MKSRLTPIVIHGCRGELDFYYLYSALMKYFIKTFGCQMNKADSERIVAVLEQAGFQNCSENETDLLIINVCSVRERAVARVYSLVSKWQKKKKIILTGCLLEKDEKKLQNQTQFINIKNIASLPQIIKNKKQAINKKQKIKNKKSYLNIKPHHSDNFQAYIPIMNGCNNFCAYCVVPYTRGREISRLSEKIITEVKGLIKEGYKEITLLGQNVNSYCGKIKDQPSSPEPQVEGKSKVKMKNQNSKINFAELLQIIDAIPGKFWIRFVTSHPKDMSNELIKTVASCNKVCGYIHLPIQSGDDEVLKKMNRKYTVAKYLSLIAKIKKTIPNVSLSTDIIVGFPGETRKQFQNTVKIMQKINYDMAYIARYSPRPQTAAAKLPDNISNQEKKRRYTILNKLLQKTALKNNQKLVGREIEVLVENCKEGFCFGKTRGFKTVKFQSKKNHTGQFVMIKIIKANPWGLLGKINPAVK